MKLLLDECLPSDFRHSFRSHETHSAQFAGLNGTKNGQLIRAAESAGYEVLLTMDRGMPFQQNLAKNRLSIVLIRAKTNQLEDLIPLSGSILDALEKISLGEIVLVS